MHAWVHKALAAATAALTLLVLPTGAVADGTVPNPGESVDIGFSPDALAASLVGPGVTVTNVVLTGRPEALGHFTFTNPAVVGFGQGVVMSSGRAVDVVGPNVSDSTSTDWVLPGDPDLDTLSGYPTQDAVVLEFDFLPAANQVVFHYAFASDEYPEWVHTPYNDVFAFFVNGLNCATARQVAGDPTSPFVPVAVNNINNSNPVQDPPPAPDRPDLFRANYFDPTGAPSVLDLEQDGITQVLTCQAPVNPGVTNHMKLAIADASDGVYDSAVFIEAGSLVSNKNPVADLSLLPETGPAPLAVTAAVEGQDPDGLPLTYSIHWADGTPDSTGTLPGETALVTHTFANPGSYLVTLTVSNGTLSGTSSEDVEVTGTPTTIAPAITLQPIGVSVDEGATATFTAGASGQPAPTVQWQSGTGGSFTDIAGATSTTLTFTAALAENGRQYRAVFTNSAGTATTNAATLTVVPLVVATTTGLASSANPSTLGSPVVFTATVAAVPPATVVPTGSVIFTVDGVAQPPAALVAGVARLTRSDLTVGSHAVTAAYAGATGLGASASALLTQSVQYRFVGFAGKVADPPKVNDARPGRTVTLKWQITDVAGVGIATPSSFVSLTVAPASCTSWAPTGAFTPAGRNLTYQNKGTWSYDWDVPATATGCWLAGVNLADGTTQVVRFSVR